MALVLILSLSLACTSGDKASSAADSGRDALEDHDGDGFPSDEDCDDENDAVHPGADEQCNGIDDDCDGDTDEPGAIDATPWYLDSDGDGHGDPLAPVLACDAPEGYVPAADEDDLDCDDANPAVHPEADEQCNGVDDDCDGTIDDGFLEDADEDGVIDCMDDCPVYAQWGATGAQDGSAEAPYPTIQHALNHRGGSCDEVLVLPGTYEEDIDLGDRDVVLASTSGADSTVIVGSGDDAVVTIMGGQTTATIVSGFTVTGGAGRPGDESLGFDPTATGYGLGHGGGFVVMEASPIIENCIVADNVVEGQGGGFYLSGWDGELRDNTIRDNESRFWSGSGGGVNIFAGAGTVHGNQFLRNHATGSSGDGGGLHLWKEAKTVVEANYFEDNWATESGGAVRSFGAAAFIRNNIFIDNHPQAIQLSAGDAGNISFNTIAGTTSSGISVRVSYGVDVISSFDNNIVTGAGGYCLAVGSDDEATYVPTSFTGNVLHGCSEGTFSGFEDVTGTDGNTTDDPGFREDGTTRTWCLEEDSPLVDAATDTTSIDFFGTERPLGEAADIGACESH